MPDLVYLNESSATLRAASIAIYDAAGNPVTGLTTGAVTIKTKKPGAASFSASSATITEDTGAVTGGSYTLTFTATEVNTRGDLKFEITSGSSTIAQCLGYVTIVDPVTDLWAYVVEGTYTAAQLMRLFTSALANKATGFDTATRRFRDLADTKDRITATVDGTGRIAVTLNLT